MAKPGGRQVKKQVRQILAMDSQAEAMRRLRRIDEKQLISPLFACFYAMADTIRFRSGAVLGDLAARMVNTSRIELARIILRRLMWNLNDESGGIGWGSAEAMGEILSRSTQLADEFGSILLSYIDPAGNYLEHERLQQGVLWGVGTYLGTAGPVHNDTLDHLRVFLTAPDPVKRGYAARALAGRKPAGWDYPEAVLSDDSPVPVFLGWQVVSVPVSRLAC